MERPVQFDSDGRTLRGVLHLPERGSGRGFIFVNAGLRYRIGPRQIYVRLARRLTAEGVACLRFDFPGVGNSDGEIVDAHYDVFDTADTSRAVDLLIREAGVERVTVLGLCSGSRNAVKSAAGDPRIDSLIAVSLPIRFVTPRSATARRQSERTGRSEVVSPESSRFLVSSYLRRSRRPGAWLRLLTLRSDYRYIGQILGAFVRLRAGRGGNGADAGREILDSCRSYLASGRRALFVYGESDTALLQDYRETIARLIEREPALAPSSTHELSVVSGARHTFDTIAAQRALTDRILAWTRQTTP